MVLLVRANDSRVRRRSGAAARRWRAWRLVRSARDLRRARMAPLTRHRKPQPLLFSTHDTTTTLHLISQRVR